MAYNKLSSKRNFASLILIFVASACTSSIEAGRVVSMEPNKCFQGFRTLEEDFCDRPHDPVYRAVMKNERVAYLIHLGAKKIYVLDDYRADIAVDSLVCVDTNPPVHVLPRTFDCGLDWDQEAQTQ